MLLTTGTRLTCDRKPYQIELEDGTRIPARAIVIATRFPLLPKSVSSLWARQDW